MVIVCKMQLCFRLFFKKQTKHTTQGESSLMFHKDGILIAQNVF